MADRELKFDAPETFRLREGGDVIRGGATFIVSASRATALLAEPNLPVRDMGTREDLTVPPGRELSELSRAELETLARDANLNPAEYRTKRDLTKILKSKLEAEGGAGRKTEQEK